jgi:hypothetical protein
MNPNANRQSNDAARCLSDWGGSRRANIRANAVQWVPDGVCGAASGALATVSIFHGAVVNHIISV